MNPKILKKLAVIAAKEAAKSMSPMKMMEDEVEDTEEEMGTMLHCPKCDYEGLPSEFVTDPKTVVVLAKADEE